MNVKLHTPKDPEEDSIMNAMFEEIRAAEAVISQARKKYN